MIQIEECARGPGQSCCCFCRGEYIRITYTLWPLFRAAFCIQNNIKGLFILHCLPFVLLEAVEAGRVCPTVCACVYMNYKAGMKVRNLLPLWKLWSVEEHAVQVSHHLQ